jgi:hypothetical protein
MIDFRCSFRTRPYDPHVDQHIHGAEKCHERAWLLMSVGLAGGVDRGAHASADQVAPAGKVYSARGAIVGSPLSQSARSGTA